MQKEFFTGFYVALEELASVSMLLLLLLTFGLAGVKCEKGVAS